MLTLQQIKEDPELIIKRLAVKGFDGKQPINEILELDNNRRQLQLNNDNLAAQQNKAAATIGGLMKQKKKPKQLRLKLPKSKKNKKKFPKSLHK